LLPFVESAPRAYRLKASNAAPPSSTSAGTFPARRTLDLRKIHQVGRIVIKFGVNEHRLADGAVANCLPDCTNRVAIEIAGSTRQHELARLRGRAAAEV
jgi:hypothetical protein